MSCKKAKVTMAFKGAPPSWPDYESMERSTVNGYTYPISR